MAAALLSEISLEPPVGVDVIASLQGISRVEVVPQPWAGCLTTTDQGLVIRLSDRDSRSRQRFTAFHEVSHTFLPGFALAPQFRCDPGENQKRSNEEYLCDLGASELLFPRYHFERDITELSFGMDSVELLARKYEGSLEATTRRLVDLSADQMMMVVLDVRLKPSEVDSPNATPKLRVRYCHGNGDWPFVPKFKSTTRDSVAQLAFEDGEAHGATKLDGLVPGFDSSVKASALSCPYFDNQGEKHERVIALYRKPERGTRMGNTNRFSRV